MKESVIEAKVIRHAEQQGCFTTKCTGMKGIPDRLVIHEGRHIFIEFKQLGKTPEPIQETVIAKITQAGGKVYVIDNVRDGKELIDKFITRMV